LQVAPSRYVWTGPTFVKVEQNYNQAQLDFLSNYVLERITKIQRPYIYITGRCYIDWKLNNFLFFIWEINSLPATHQLIVVFLFSFLILMCRFFAWYGWPCCTTFQNLKTNGGHNARSKTRTHYYHRQPFWNLLTFSGWHGRRKATFLILQKLRNLFFPYLFLFAAHFEILFLHKCHRLI